MIERLVNMTIYEYIQVIYLPYIIHDIIALSETWLNSQLSVMRFLPTISQFIVSIDLRTALVVPEEVEYSLLYDIANTTLVIVFK